METPEGQPFQLGKYVNIKILKNKLIINYLSSQLTKKIFLQILNPCHHLFLQKNFMVWKVDVRVKLDH